MAALPSIVTSPGPFLKKLADVGRWLDSLGLREIGNNGGFASNSNPEWASAITSWIYSSSKPSELPSNSRTLPKGSNGPYCGMAVALVTKLAATYCTDMTTDEKNFVLGLGCISSSSCWAGAWAGGSEYLARVAKPQPGSINSKSSSGGGHVNISVFRENQKLVVINGNGSCNSKIETGERDASSGSGICAKYGPSATLLYSVIFRVGGKFPVEPGNSIKGKGAGSEGGYGSYAGDSSGGGSEGGGGSQPPPKKKLRTFDVAVGTMGSQSAADDSNGPSCCKK